MSIPFYKTIWAYHIVINAMTIYYLNSKKFISKYSKFDPFSKKLKIDSHLTDIELDNILQMTQKMWQDFGEHDPHWSVLSLPEFKKSNIDTTEDNFFSTGKDTLRLLLASLERNGLSKDTFKTVLEIGCGVGRVTKDLASSFSHVYAVDISKNHLQIAEKHCKSNSNINFIHIQNFNSYEKLPKCDIVFSIIVLQHNPPPVIEYIIKRMFNSLNIHGVAYFQVPTYSAGYEFVFKKYIERAGKNLEMHVLPQNKIFNIAYDCGCIPLEVHQDGWADPLYSNTFLFQKIKEPAPSF